MITDGPLVDLSKEQQSALDKILQESEDDHILTGKAGAGKSTIIRALQSKAPTFISATTGVAALNVGGCTIDTLFSIDRNKWEIRNPRTLDMNMRKVPRRIVIDECSQLGTKLADLVFDAARKYDKQLILVGDFAQSAPVKDTPAVETPLFMRAKLTNLLECHRQDGGEYLDALNQVRYGEVNDFVRDTFRSRIVDIPEDGDEKTMRIFATRALVDSHNSRMLVRNSAPAITCVAEYIDNRDQFMKTKYPISAEQAQAALERSPMAHQAQFKVGARVMMTLNVYDSNGGVARWVNGDLGVIVDVLDDKLVSMNGRKPALGKPLRPTQFIVKLDRTGVDTTVGIVDMPVYGVGPDPVAYLSGFPMTLGYSITGHKVQGLTLPKCIVDMKSITYHPSESRHGLAYVALSRVRKLEDLYLTNWDDSAVYCSPEMRKFIHA